MKPVSRLVARLAALFYREDQQRDDRGRWTSEGRPKPPKRPRGRPRKDGSANQRSALAGQIRHARGTASSRDRLSEIANSARAMRHYRRGLPRPEKRVRGASRFPQAQGPSKSKGAEPKKPPPFGQSRAAASIQGGHAKAVGELGKKMFGREVSTGEWASLAGAPHNAKVKIGVSDDGHSVLVAWQSKHASAQRAIKVKNGQPVIHNHSLMVHKEHQGQGIGREVFGRQVETGQALGAHHMETWTSRSHETNGHYTWPRFGYDAKIPGDLKAKLPKRLAKAENLSDLMRSKVGRDWWKKNGTEVHGTFDLDPKSKSSRVWNAYLREKQKAEAQ